MISPAKLDKLPAEVVDLVEKLQEDIISDICRRVTKAKYLTPSAEWQLYKANQLNLSYSDVNRRIAKQLKVRERTVQELYNDTVKQAIKEDADIYRIAAAMGKLPGNTGTKIDSYFRSASFSRLLSKGLKNCTKQLRNLCSSMAAEANRQLSDAMDLAHLKVISGAYSYNEAIYSAVKELTDKGITRVTYPSGRRDNVDVCVRRAVLSSVNKSCCDIQLDLANEVGSRYVEVTAHIGARPSHAEWQGQIYSLVKGDPKYPYFYEATGYGTGEGLGGWNCRHNFFPFFEGIDTPYHSPEFSKTENNEYYALTQKQRAYERAVRDSKRQLAALDGARQAAEDPALRARLDSDFARRSVTLKNREERLNSFIRDNDLQRDNSRVRVAGFGKSVSQKAVWAERKFNSPSGLTNGGGSGTIKSIDVDDFTMMASSHNIMSEVSELIANTIREYERKGGMYISDMHFGSFFNNETGKPALMQVFQNYFGLTEININSSLMGGKSIDEIDQMIASTTVNLPQNLREAVIHECGHAKAYYGKTAEEIISINKELKNLGVEGISRIAKNDGAECIAEVEVLLSRGEAVPEKAMALYKKYVNGEDKK